MLVRKTYGQAYINMGGGRNSDEFLAWPTAEVSFMDPNYAVTVVSGLKPGDPGFEEEEGAHGEGQLGLRHRVDLRGAGRDPSPNRRATT